MYWIVQFLFVEMVAFGLWMEMYGLVGGAIFMAVSVEVMRRLVCKLERWLYGDEA